jgi:hypothetical protein
MCTTITIPLPGGNGSVPDSELTPGVCVQSQDKIFGNFNLGNLPQVGGTVVFGFVNIGPIDRHTITFTNVFAENTTYNSSFEVEVVQGSGFATNNFITQMNADFIQSEGGPTTLMQTTNPAGTSGSINLTKTANVPTGPFQIFFTQNVTDMVVSTTFATGPGSDATSVADTIIEQVQTPTPEPNALELLGLALTGFGLFGLRRKS